MVAEGWERHLGRLTCIGAILEHNGALLQALACFIAGNDSQTPLCRNNQPAFICTASGAS